MNAGDDLAGAFGAAQFNLLGALPKPETSPSDAALERNLISGVISGNGSQTDGAAATWSTSEAAGTITTACRWAI